MATLVISAGVLLHPQRVSQTCWRYCKARRVRKRAAGWRDTNKTIWTNEQLSFLGTSCSSTREHGSRVSCLKAQNKFSRGIARGNSRGCMATTRYFESGSRSVRLLDLRGTTTPGRAPPTTAHWPPSVGADADWLTCDRKLPEHTCKKGWSSGWKGPGRRGLPHPGPSCHPTLDCCCVPAAATRRPASCTVHWACRTSGGRPHAPPSVARLCLHSVSRPCARRAGCSALLRVARGSECGVWVAGLLPWLWH